MSKIADDFWLSPDGEVYYCISHNSMADDIVMKRGWMDELFELFDNGKTGSRIVPGKKRLDKTLGSTLVSWLVYSTRHKTNTGSNG